MKVQKQPVDSKASKQSEKDGDKNKPKQVSALTSFKKDFKNDLA